MKVVGVTGTKGKSTVAVMIREMLESLGQKCGLIGTIEHHLGNEVVTSQNTTPDAFTIQSYFAKMVEAGCHYCGDGGIFTGNKAASDRWNLV